MYLPFIDDPEHLHAVDGERYVVLRPSGNVLQPWQNAKSKIQRILSGQRYSFPATPHVTLAGFPRGTPLDQLQAAVGDWARQVAPLRLVVERLSHFDGPLVIPYVEIRKLPELAEAQKLLIEMARRNAIAADAAIPPEAWVFHMSVAYCGELAAESRAAVEHLFEPTSIPTLECVVNAAEIAAYDNGSERSGGEYPFRG